MFQDLYYILLMAFSREVSHSDYRRNVKSLHFDLRTSVRTELKIFTFYVNALPLILKEIKSKQNDENFRNSERGTRTFLIQLPAFLVQIYISKIISKIQIKLKCSCCAFCVCVIPRGAMSKKPYLVLRMEETYLDTLSPSQDEVSQVRLFPGVELESQ